MPRPERNENRGCAVCLLLSRDCLCGDFESVDNQVEVRIVRHVRERFKRSNSARLVAHTLRHCRIFDYGAMGTPFDAESSIPDGAWLLFSGDPESGATRPPPNARPSSLIVLDGTWPQARRMYKRLSVLASLPRVSLSPPANAPMRLRTPTTPEGMATSEAIARALELLGDADAAAALDRIFALMVQRLSRSGHR